jgi:hypothetical protein
MEQSWITDIAMLMEQSSIDPSPKPVRGMSPSTEDYGNSNYRKSIGISDGSPVSRAMANTAQQTFSSEQEEENVISKSIVVQMIENMLGDLTPADNNAGFLLATLKKQILDSKA